MADLIRNVTVTVSGLHASEDTGEQDEIRNGYAGTCRQIDDTWYIQYQEPEEKEGGASRVLLKVQPDCLEITRRGGTQMHLTLRSGRRIDGTYTSQFGTLALTARTERLQVRTAVPTEGGMDIRAEYALEMDGQQLSKARLHITVRPE